VRVAPVPVKTIFAFGTSATLFELPVTVSEAAAVSTSLIVKLKADVGLSSFMVWLATVVIVGESLTVLTESWKVVVVVVVPSSTESVMTATPL
jgi:hypothetical protein